MAKQSGMSLNPGADPTLVAAAYRASMANVPKDLSGTFEALATNYAATMKTVGETWAEVAKVGGELANEAISTYTQNEKYKAMAINIRNQDSVSFLYDKLMETRQGIKDTYYNPVKTEIINGIEVPLENWKDINKGKRFQLKQDKEQLEAQIVDFNNISSNIATRLESGDYNEAATGSNWPMIVALGAYATPSGKTKDGSYVKPDINDNGEIFFTLYDSNDNEVKRNGTDENVTIKAGDAGGLLAKKNDTVVSNANKLFTNLEVSGKVKGRKYDMDGKVFKKNFGKLLKNEDDMHILMNEDLYMLDQTFYQDVTNSSLDDNGSVTSATIWSSMGGILPTDSKGNPLDIDISGGTDKNALDAGDFQNVNNYNKLVGAILDKTNKFYNKEVTKRIFEEWAHQNGEKAFTYGAGMRAPVSGSDDGDKTQYINLWGKDVGYPTTQGDKEKLATIQNIANDAPTVIVNGVEYKRVQGAGYDYRAVKDNKGTITSGGDEVTKEYLIRLTSPIYGNVPDGWFERQTRTYTPPPVNEAMKGMSIGDMKKALPKAYDLEGKSDEEIKKLYKKYYISLLKEYKKEKPNIVLN